MKKEFTLNEMIDLVDYASEHHDKLTECWQKAAEQQHDLQERIFAYFQLMSDVKAAQAVKTPHVFGQKDSPSWLVCTFCDIEVYKTVYENMLNYPKFCEDSYCDIPSDELQSHHVGVNEYGQSYCEICDEIF